MKNKKINCTPLFNKLLVTANKEQVSKTNSGIYTPFGYSKGAIKDRQTVLKVGTTVRDIKDGDEVLINWAQYSQLKHKPGSIQDDVMPDNPIVNIIYPYFKLDDGTECLLIDDRDVVVKYTKDEEIN